MRVQVTRLRHHGAKLSRKELRREDRLEGSLSFAYLGGTPFLSLQSLTDNNPGGRLAVLYEPALTGIAHGSFYYRGVERITGFVAGQEVSSAGVVQEWIVTVLHPGPDGAWPPA